MISNIKKNVPTILRFATGIYGVFLILAVPMIAFFIHVTPLGWGLDELGHAPRAYQISQVNLYPDRHPESDSSYGGSVSTSFQEAFLYGWAGSNSVNRDHHPYERSDLKSLAPEAAQYEDRKLGESVSYYDFGPSGPYAPIVYFPASIGIAISKALDLSVGQAGNLSRSIQASFYIFACLVSFYIVRNLKVKWLFFAVALLPSSLYQASVISADPVTTGIVLIFLALVISAFLSKTALSRRRLFALVGLTIVLGLVKQNYALLGLAVLFIPGGAFSSAKQHLSIKLFAMLGWLVAFVSATAKGLVYSGAIAQYRGDLMNDISLSGQLLWMVTHPIGALEVFYKTFSTSLEDWHQSLIGIFGYTTVPVPFFVVLVYSVLIFLLAIYADAPRKRIHAWLIFGISLASALSIVVVLYGTFTPVGSESVAGVQGRYFIPVLLPLVYGFAKLLPARLDINKGSVRPLVYSTVGICLIYTGLTYAMSMY